MSSNHTVIVNGVQQQINLSNAIDLTKKKDVARWNEDRKKRHKKHFSIMVSIKSKPLGDIVDKLTTITGIKWLITKLFKECGCEKRRQYLNKWDIFIPSFYIKNGLAAPKDIEVQELTQELLSTNNNTEAQPIPRNFTKSERKPCNCGMKTML